MASASQTVSPSIQAVPCSPEILVVTTGGPQVAPELCMIPSTPLSVRKWTV